MLQKGKRLNAVQKTRLIEKKGSCCCTPTEKCLRCVALEVINAKDMRIADLRDKLSKIKSEGASTRISNRRLLAEIAEKEKYLNDLAVKYTDRRLQAEKLQDQINRGEEYARNASGQIGALNKQLETARNETETVRAAVLRLEEELKIARRSAQNYQKEYAQLDEKYEGQEEIIKEFRKKADLDTETIHELVKAVKQDSLIITELREELYQIKDRLEKERIRGDQFYGKR